MPKALGPVGKYVANAVTFGGRTAGSEAEHRAAERTGDANAEPNLEDKLIGLKSTAEQAALNQIGLNKIISPSKVASTGLNGVARAGGNVIVGGLTEGATSAGQNLISQAEAKQTLDPSKLDGHEALAQGVLGGIGGGVFSSPKGAKDAVAAVKLRDTNPDVHTAMAANRLLDYVSKPKELEDPTTAYKATSVAIDSVKGELTEAAKAVTNPSTEASNAIARAKAGETLTPKEFAAIDREGNVALSSLARQAHELSKLTERGNFDSGEGRFAGGAGEAAKERFGGLAKYFLGGGLGAHAAGALASGPAGVDTYLSSLPTIAEGTASVYAGYRALKALDRVAGLSSPARSFAEKFGDSTAGLRPDVPLNQRPTGPQVPQQNSVTTQQPWGPVAPKPTAFKPDMLDSNIAKLVDNIQNQKRRDTAQEAMPLLRQLAEQNQPAPAAPGPDPAAMNEQVKSALLMAAARRKIAGQQQAEAEASDSHAINEAGGLDTLRNPAFGKRGSELLQAANVMNRLRAVPEPEAPPAPEPPVAPTVNPGVAQPKNVDVRGAIPTDAPEPPPQPGSPANAPQFVLPESPYWHLDPKTAADHILNDARKGEKPIRNEEAYHAGTVRRLKGEEDIYNAISRDLNNVQERGDFHKYLSALWGSDSPEVVRQVREQMVTEFPHREAQTRKHLSDGVIAGLWNTKPKKK